MCVGTKARMSAMSIALLYALTHHLRHIEGVCIVQEGIWHPYFVHYIVDHPGRPKIWLSKTLWGGKGKKKMSAISICSTICSDTSLKKILGNVIWRYAGRKRMSVVSISSTVCSDILFPKTYRRYLIVQEGTLPPHFVHYLVYHPGRTKIGFKTSHLMCTE